MPCDRRSHTSNDSGGAGGVAAAAGLGSKLGRCGDWIAALSLPGGDDLEHAELCAHVIAAVPIAPGEHALLKELARHVVFAFQTSEDARCVSWMCALVKGKRVPAGLQIRVVYVCVIILHVSSAETEVACRVIRLGAGADLFSDDGFERMVLAVQEGNVPFDDACSFFWAAFVNGTVVARVLFFFFLRT
jgi:hypothetical protein